MPFPVRLTDDAVRDLEELYDYIARNDNPRNAGKVLDRIAAVFTRLSESPDRGSRPRELLALGIRDFQQVFSGPYRIVYRVIDNTVYILVIADGRRDMQSLLQRRLFEAD